MIRRGGQRPLSDIACDFDGIAKSGDAMPEFSDYAVGFGLCTKRPESQVYYIQVGHGIPVEYPNAVTG